MNMKYLFFDLESANSKDFKGNIYSFGYTLSTSDLVKDDVIEDIIINPDPDRWDWYVKKKMLVYKMSQLNNSPKFNERYDFIKSLLCDDNNIVFGYAIINDIRYLVNDCNRYKLDYLHFKYIDVKHMIDTIENRVSASLGTEYTIFTTKTADSAHRSDMDSYYTKEIVKALLNKYGKEVIDKYIIKHIQDTNKLDYESYNSPKAKKVRKKSIKEGQENHILRCTENYSIFHKLLDEVKKEEGYKDIFKGKKITMSLNYETYNCKEMLQIIQSVTNHGGEYIKKGSLADIFVTYKSDRECSRLKYVNDAILEGKNIEIVEFNDFINLLSIKL